MMMIIQMILTTMFMMTATTITSAKDGDASSVRRMLFVIQLHVVGSHCHN